MHQSPPEGFNINAFGVNVRINFRGNFSEGTAQRARTAWEGASFTSGREPDVKVTLAPAHEASLLQGLSSRVTADALEFQRGRLLMFHAAGIASPAGEVIAFVGPSGQGKTTLIQHLGKHYAYVSDETIALTPDLEVLPYRKPLSVRTGDTHKQQISPLQASLQPLPDASLRLKRLYVLNRTERIDEPSVTPLTLSEALTGLVAQSSSLIYLERPLQQLAQLCARTGGVLKLTYHEASTLPCITSKMFDAPTFRLDWHPAIDGDDTTTAVESLSTPQQPTLSIHENVLDAIHTNGHTIVLTREGNMHTLDGIAPALWETARAGMTLSEAVSEMIATFGEPEHTSAEEIVPAAVQELVELSLLSITN